MIWKRGKGSSLTSILNMFLSDEDTSGQVYSTALFVPLSFFLLLLNSDLDYDNFCMTNTHFHFSNYFTIIRVVQQR